MAPSKLLRMTPIKLLRMTLLVTACTGFVPPKDGGRVRRPTVLAGVYRFSFRKNIQGRRVR